METIDCEIEFCDIIEAQKGITIEVDHDVDVTMRIHIQHHGRDGGHIDMYYDADRGCDVYEAHVHRGGVKKELRKSGVVDAKNFDM